uniref:Metallo-beta-lactamase domain-containing protein 1 n=1 Tax=Meloidogyne incognita TaxID=6306 RepID=A0A914M051_MELIC
MPFSEIIEEKQMERKTEKLENKPNQNLINNDQNNSKAFIYIIREGLARKSDLGFTFVASITLIKDEGKIILVDTGLATDINGRTDLIEKLANLGIAPPAIDIVVTTHGHADHSGNTNIFSDAIHYQGSIVHHRMKFNFSSLFENRTFSLTKNINLIKTPGHTQEDISIVVKVIK